MTGKYLAVEAGGTKFRAAVTDADLRVLREERIDTTEPVETLDAVLAFARADASDELTALGIASFGPVIVDEKSPDFGSIGATPKPGWSGTPLLRRLTDELGIPGAIQTDVEAAAVAEQNEGAATGDRAVAYVTVGTGIGAAVAINGVPVRGRSHAELGHIPVRRDPVDDYVGHCPFHADCLEGMASGPAIGDRWGVERASELDDRTDVWQIEAGYLTQLVRVLNYGFAPDRIVIGGGVGGRPGLIERMHSAIDADLAGYAVHHASAADLVVRAKLPDAGMTGASILARSLAD